MQDALAVAKKAYLEYKPLLDSKSTDEKKYVKVAEKYAKLKQKYGRDYLWEHGGKPTQWLNFWMNSGTTRGLSRTA